MSKNQPPTFSALRVAESLTAEQLEYITEFSGQAESFRFLSRSIKGPQPTLQEAIEILDAAPAVLKKKNKKIKPADKAWHAELRTEFLNLDDREGDRLPAVLSVGEIRIFIDATRDDMRDHLIFRVFYATGMRISEVANLLVGDLYLEELKVFVRDGKGDKDRYAMLDPETAELLAEFTATLKPGDKVFEIGARQISRVIEDYAEELGIKERYNAIGRNFTPHSIRHTAATHLFESGMELYILKDVLGHASASTTRGYVHTGINYLRKSYQKHHPLCQPQKEEDPERA